MSNHGFVQRLRNSNYTGTNRCLPCTILNLVILGALGLFLGGLVNRQVGSTAGGLTGSVVVSMGALVVYFRGYLVPGTPTLTKRYLPRRILRWFGKAPLVGTHGAETVDVEAVLREANASVPSDDGTDLKLNPDFLREWREMIHVVRDETAGETAIAELFGVSAERISLHDTGAAFRATLEGDHREVIAEWESRAAYLAEAAGSRVFAERSPAWAHLDPHERCAVLSGLRVLLTECPDCGGEVAFGEETVESCCNEYSVIAVSCQSCGARIFEHPLTDDMKPDPNPLESPAAGT